MRTMLARSVVAGAAVVALMGQAPVKPAPEVRLYRLDCGRGDLPKNFFNDEHAYADGAMISVVASCYLIRHGQDVLLWDTGFGAETIGDKSRGLTVTLTPQLAAIGVKPADVKMVGISHSHGDHTGQAKDFVAAQLLIGAAEYDALFGPNASLAESAKPLQAWAGGTNVKKVSGDLDVYGDGSVVALALPGHTPGHLALQVKLAKTGYVILSGDQYHFRENRTKNGVPGFNWNRADSLASNARLEGLIKNLKARLIIQHDAQDNAALPKPPAYLD